MTSPSSSSKSAPSGAKGKSSAVALTAAGKNIELGKYRILRLLGQGGFGITYLAQHMETGQEVVVKENLPTDFMFRDPRNLQVVPMSDELEADCRWAMESFLQEARLLMKLDHPNIVKVQDAFSALGTAYYVMPWVGGNELGQAAPAPDKITENWLSPILRQLLEALQYLHGQNILHRDIKPSNILMSEGGEPVLIDFGAARAIISEKSATKVGSPGYTPIEQVQSKGKRGPWTDLYALGATCYRLITGHRPPQCEDRIGEDDEYHPLAPQAKLYSRFSRDFLASIDKALAFMPNKRWQQAEDWLATLPAPKPAEPTPEPIIIPPGPQPIPGPVPSPPVPASAPKPAGTSLSIKLTFAALILIILGGGWYGYHTISAMQAQIEEAQAQAERKRQEAIQSLSSRGISSFEYDDKLIDAAYEGDVELVSLLLTAGANVNAADYIGETPLYRAAKEGHTEVVRLLLATPGIDVNKADEYGWTPLYPAAYSGNTEVVRLLLAVPGIEVNKATNSGATPLDSAAWNGRTEVVRLLLAVPGIEVNKATNSGATPLYSAAWNGHTEVVRLLLAAPGIDVNKASTAGWCNGKTPLYSAAWNGHTEVVHLLLAAPGIDVNKASTAELRNGQTPLYRAAYSGHTEVVRLLLATPGIDVNKADKAGNTPLYRAAWEGHTEVVRLLLAAPGIDVNKASTAEWRNGQTPLYRAAWEGHTEVVRLLLAAPGIEVNKTTKLGYTPLDAAKTEEIERMLRAAGGKTGKELGLE